MKLFKISIIKAFCIPENYYVAANNEIEALTKLGEGVQGPNIRIVIEAIGEYIP